MPRHQRVFTMTIDPNLHGCKKQQATAVAYVRRGWRVIPVPFREKKPRLAGWQKLRLAGSELLNHFANEKMNIGVLLGEPSGIVDVDLDAPEALKLAADLLPPTDSIFGRNGNPASHRIYAATVNGRSSAKFTGPAGDSLVEIRSTGAQTLFPCSVHPTGDVIDWESNGEPQNVDLPVLETAARELAAGCLLLRCYPESGSRHNFALGLAGGLLRAGWSVSRVERFVEVIAEAAGDDEVEDRIRVVADTKAAITAGEKATGWPSLAKLIDGAGTKEKFVDRVMTLLRVDRTPRESAVARVLSTPAPSAPRLWRPFPVDLLPTPIRSFIVEGSKATGVDPTMYVLPVLAVCAAAIGTTRRVRIKRTWLEPSILWTVPVARSGQVKSPPFDDAVRPLKMRETQSLRDHEDVLLEHDANITRWEIANKAWKSKGHEENPDPPSKPTKPEPSRLITTDPTTEAITLLLSHNPRGLLLCRDELSGWFNSFNCYRGGRGSDISCWDEMYCGKMMIGDRKTGDKTIHVDHASVSITGTIQPRILRRVLTQEYFEAGLSARLLLAMPPPRRKRWTDSELSEDAELVYDHIIGNLLTLKHRDESGGHTSAVDIPFTPDALKLFVEFYDQHAIVQEQTADDDLAAAFAKLEAVAARLAMIFHFIRWADDDLDDPDFVGTEDTTAAILITRWFIHETERVYTIFGEDEVAIEARELLDWVMIQGGSATARDLQLHSRRYPTSQAATDAIDDLVRRKWGQWEYERPGPTGGAPSKRFVVATEKAVDNTSAEEVVGEGIVGTAPNEDEK